MVNENLESKRWLIAITPQLDQKGSWYLHNQPVQQTENGRNRKCIDERYDDTKEYESESNTN